MSRRTRKIALAPIVGLGLGLLPLIMYMKRGYDEGAQTDHAWQGVSDYGLYALTGFAKGADGKYAWNADGLANGLIPLVTFGVGGILLHKLANKTGVNRSIPWFSI